MSTLSRKADIKEDVIAKLWQEARTRHETQVIRRRIRGEQPPAKKRMVTIHEGVMEYGESDRFEGAVQTSEGPRKLEGRVFQIPTDPQSRRLCGWHGDLQSAEAEIKRATENVDVDVGISVIERIWEGLDKASELAAARMRILLNKKDLPNLGPLPEWFSSQVKSQGLASMETASKLIRACLSEAKNLDASARIDMDGLGRTMIEWSAKTGSFHWLVEPIELPWPSIKLYQLTRRDGEAPSTRVIHSAFEAIKAFRVFFGV